MTSHVVFRSGGNEESLQSHIPSTYTSQRYHFATLGLLLKIGLLTGGNM
jgi:hypothetical protein